MYILVMDEKPLYANTYINVFSQKLVRHFVLLEDVVIDASAGKGSTSKEAEQSTENPSVHAARMQ